MAGKTFAEILRKKRPPQAERKIGARPRLSCISGLCHLVFAFSDAARCCRRGGIFFVAILKLSAISYTIGYFLASERCSVEALAFASRLHSHPIPSRPSNRDAECILTARAFSSRRKKCGLGKTKYPFLGKRNQYLAEGFLRCPGCRQAVDRFHEALRVGAFPVTTEKFPARAQKILCPGIVGNLPQCTGVLAQTAVRKRRNSRGLEELPAKFPASRELEDQARLRVRAGRVGGS
jgi:hypothetical protein